MPTRNLSRRCVTGASKFLVQIPSGWIWSQDRSLILLDPVVLFEISLLPVQWLLSFPWPHFARQVAVHTHSLKYLRISVLIPLLSFVQTYMFEGDCRTY